MARRAGADPGGRLPSLPSSTSPGSGPAPAPRPPVLRGAWASPLPTRDRKVESHQVGPEPHLNVVHDRRLHHGDLWKRQAAARQPAARQGRQNSGHVNPSSPTEPDVHRAEHVGAAGGRARRQPRGKRQVREAAALGSRASDGTGQDGTRWGGRRSTRSSVDNFLTSVSASQPWGAGLQAGVEPLRLRQSRAPTGRGGHVAVRPGRGRGQVVQARSLKGWCPGAFLSGKGTQAWVWPGPQQPGTFLHQQTQAKARALMTKGTAGFGCLCVPLVEKSGSGLNAAASSHPTLSSQLPMAGCGPSNKEKKCN